MARLNTAAVRFACEQLSSGCDQMEKLLHGLSAVPESFEEDVHAIRKLGKSLRGGFAALGLGKSAAREIQAISRLLSASRDAVTRAETWNGLRWTEDPAVASTIEALIHQEVLARKLSPPGAAIHWCLHRLAAAQSCLAREPKEFLEDSWHGLHKLERQLRRRCRSLDRGSEEDFHEARKAVKAWLGAATVFPKGIVRNRRNLMALADELGEENDLATLASWLAGHGFTRAFAPGLWDTLAARRRKIQVRAAKRALRVDAAFAPEAASE